MERNRNKRRLNLCQLSITSLCFYFTSILCVLFAIFTFNVIAAYRRPTVNVNPSNTGRGAVSGASQRLAFGAVLPGTALTTIKRAYQKRLQDAVENLTKNRHVKYNFTNHYNIFALISLMSLDPSPTEVLTTLCKELLHSDVSTILYMTNSEVYGRNAASAQYLMQLTGYLGIPRVPESRILQLAPSVEHQASAMLDILLRYMWHVFSIVTSNVGGHDDFVRAVRDKILSYDKVNKTRNDIVRELDNLAKSEARVMLLYCTKREAQEIMAAANQLNITGKNYMWIGTQSVVGIASEYYAPGEFPSGMLGQLVCFSRSPPLCVRIHFNTTHLRLLDEIERAVTIFGNGLELYLRSVKMRDKSGKSQIEFNLDGTLKYVELNVMNLNNNGMWEKIGIWTADGLDIKDITWPGKSPVPPAGVPEKFNLKVTFLDEPSFVNMLPLDEETGKCKTSRSVLCRRTNELDSIGNRSLSRPYQCCSGFCIDLLQMFADDLKFSYELNRVEDGNWGVLNNGTWNGLIAELLNHKADVVVTSIKINSDRQSYVDFTVPFLETGITVVVAKKTGIISPKAFLEPFDVVSWIMILLISIQIAAFAIFLFEWLSPSGYNMSMRPPRDHKFSLFRTYWLVWAILFGAAVPINCPRGYTARFMSNVWATFAVVFLAIYTANLAAFMITRENFYDFSGIEDTRLVNPYLTDPPLKFGTIPNGNTEAVLKRNKPKMQSYMKKYNRSSGQEGVKAVKRGELDAFIYDAVVLDYLTGQDNDCRLLTVGSWYAMTGYGFAFPKKSKYLAKFNEKMIEYRENGDLERLRKFWFQGACKPSKRKGKISKPLDVNQFMSAFLLLGCGILLTIVLLALEHFYFRYCRRYLSKADRGGCVQLISMSMAKSLSFQSAVNETQDIAKHYICRDPLCNTQTLRLKHDLELANVKLRQFGTNNSYFRDDLRYTGRGGVYWQLATAADEHLLQTRDMTRNHIQSNDPFAAAFQTHRYQTVDASSMGSLRRSNPSDATNIPAPLPKHAIAEIETVL
ncbi:glutamate receptor ionotropic: NMDA 2B-like protein [Leptotrombidium deliense]|uniref:Glutamate receptor ionotropic: NMDA 2B-like protein n=1 Tax=Leptotrombidium deliense TaxID=299467 RepID=A0A443SVT2_9ACAR|nr:glutamate receptor ionotropic: NMDA 2B-like protein [Leptotrombidium deliense]